MKVIIAGGRTFINKGVANWIDMSLAIKHSGWEVIEVVSGGCRGVDEMGEEWARRNFIPTRVFPADWSKHGKAAGPIRNKQMAEYADALIAIWDGKSRGTKNMIETANNMGLKVYVHNYND